MSEIFKIKKTTLEKIADAIREKTGKADLISPNDMPVEILTLNSPSGETSSFFRIVGSSSRPSTVIENTIWINTNINNIPPLTSEDDYLETTGSEDGKGCYINGSGEIIEPVSNTCKTSFFPCIPGHTYRFTSPIATGRIATFTKIPALDLKGTLLYNNTDETAPQNVTVTAPEGALWMGFYYFGTSTPDTVSPPEITIIDETTPTNIATTGTYMINDIAPIARFDGGALVIGDVWLKTNNFIYIGIQDKEIKYKIMSAFIWSGERWLHTKAEIYINNGWQKLYSLIYDKGIYYEGITRKKYNGDVILNKNYGFILGGTNGGSNCITSIYTNNGLNFDDISEIKSTWFNAKRASTSDTETRYHNTMYVDPSGYVRNRFYDGTNVICGVKSDIKLDVAYPEEVLVLDVSSVTGLKYLTAQHETTGYYETYGVLTTLAYR